MKRMLILALVALTIGSGGYLSWAFANGERPFRSSFRVACEKAIVDRLRSPSSYRLVEYRESIRRMPHQEARDFALRQLRDSDFTGNMTERVEKWMRTAEEHGGYRRWRALVSYDAANGFGSLIREVSTCEYAGYALDSPVLKLAISVDGQTSVEHLAGRLE